MNEGRNSSFTRANGRLERRKAILLTSYNTGANRGKNLGIAGYSHDIVAALYHPLLSRWGEVVFVENPRLNLEAEVSKVRERGLDPIHVSIIPLQDVCLAESAINVVVPAWEFPDIPDYEFDGNPQNDWIATAKRCTALVVGGPFTLDAFRKAGCATPIHIVPVPTPDAYFQVPSWNLEDDASIEYPAILLEYEEKQPQRLAKRLHNPISWKKPNQSSLKQFGKYVECQIRDVTKRVFGRSLYKRIFGAARMAYHILRTPAPKPYNRRPRFDLTGVVYTSIFNPLDGRKNWEDLLTGFLLGLGDCDDATLVVKLITSNPEAVQKFVEYYRNCGISHRCRIVVITDFLSEDQMIQLAQVSTYYLHTTKAEGNCLPLMNFMAAGRPGISPCHSAISDYFDDSVGFVVESHQEPAAWPHDRQLQLRSTWARIVWTSLVEQLRASYQMAKSRPDAYQALASSSRERMQGWASEDQVWKCLSATLDATVNGEEATVGREDSSFSDEDVAFSDDVQVVGNHLEMRRAA